MLRAIGLCFSLVLFGAGLSVALAQEKSTNVVGISKTKPTSTLR